MTFLLLLLHTHCTVFALCYFTFFLYCLKLKKNMLFYFFSVLLEIKKNMSALTPAPHQQNMHANSRYVSCTIRVNICTYHSGLHIKFTFCCFYKLIKILDLLKTLFNILKSSMITQDAIRDEKIIL